MLASIPFAVRWASGRPRIRTSLIAIVVTALVGGCGAEVGGGGEIFPSFPFVLFKGWGSISPTECRGTLENDGRKTAANVRVRVYYTTASGESLVVVTPAVDRLEPNARTTFVVPPQMTRGEFRYPRCETVFWDGGLTQAEAVAPSLHLFGWCPVAPDSMRCYLVNAATTYVYNPVLRVECRDGVVNRTAVPDHLGGVITIITYFTSTTRDSAGITLPPKMLALTWENYGGVADSLVIADLPNGGVGFSECPLP